MFVINVLFVSREKEFFIVSLKNIPFIKIVFAEYNIDNAKSHWSHLNISFLQITDFFILSSSTHPHDIPNLYDFLQQNTK